MSVEAPIGGSQFEHRDSPLYMMMRRTINEEYAAEPLDFNVAGLMAGQIALGREYTEDDLIVDIGSSTGAMVARAAAVTETNARILCIEPAHDAAFIYASLPHLRRSNVLFAQAEGEHLPLVDNSAQGVTMHNVIFRAKDAAAMLREAQRVVVPGGFIAISTNFKGHALYRHMFEEMVARAVASNEGVNFTPPPPPAAGKYVGDMEALVGRVGGLFPLDDLYVEQKTQAVITEGERLKSYVESIKHSAKNTDLPEEYHRKWRVLTDMIVTAAIRSEMMLSESKPEVRSGEQAPYFGDPIHRGMFVLQNERG
jgi:ubiquinone/menaquinone biosynthesis C-methylase UbiE